MTDSVAPEGSKAHRRTLEICAYSVVDAAAAAEVGADRIELCRAPEADGLTPTDAELVVGARLCPTLPVHPIVRPRHSFEVTDEDAELMANTLHRIRDLGYPGAVLGALDPSGTTPDWPMLRRLANAGQGLALTFHRAFDQVSDQTGALARLADCGFARVLTSGRPGRAVDHLELLGRLIEVGERNGIDVMPGGSVLAADVPALVKCGASEVHASAGGSRGQLSLPEVRALATAMNAAGH